MEFGGLAAVEVLHHGVEAGDFLAALDEEDADALGAFEAFEVVGDVGDVFAIDGVAVGAEVFDEVGGDEIADEFGAEGMSELFSMPKLLTRSRRSWRRMSRPFMSGGFMRFLRGC